VYFADNLGWHLVVVGLLGESMHDFFHPAELPLLHWFCCYWLYYLCYSEFGLHLQQVDYYSIVGLMFDIHHFGFCCSCVINTNKGQTQVQPEYYTPYNNIGHPVNPIRTTIVPTEGEYRHRQAQNKGLPPLGTTYQLLVPVGVSIIGCVFC
jgi:hypothetical protein